MLFPLKEKQIGREADPNKPLHLLSEQAPAYGNRDPRFVRSEKKADVELKIKLLYQKYLS